MPKNPTSKRTKILSFTNKYPKEFYMTREGEMWCRGCEKIVSANLKSLVESHRKSSKYISFLDNIGSHEEFNILNLTHFHDDIVELFIKSDIPLYKLTSPHFVKFLSNYNLPSVSQSTTHRRIKKIADNKLNKIKTKLVNQNIFIIADDTIIHKKYYTNILIGDLQNKKNTWLNAMYQKPIII